jgi:hypothetical protein
MPSSQVHCIRRDLCLGHSFSIHTPVKVCFPNKIVTSHFPSALFLNSTSIRSKYERHSASIKHPHLISRTTVGEAEPDSAFLSPEQSTAVRSRYESFPRSSWAGFVVPIKAVHVSWGQSARLWISCLPSVSVPEILRQLPSPWMNASPIIVRKNVVSS